MQAQSFEFQLWKGGDLRAEETAPISIGPDATGTVILRPYFGNAATYFRVEYRRLKISPDPQWQGWLPALFSLSIDQREVSTGTRPGLLHTEPNSRPCDVVHFPSAWNRPDLREAIGKHYGEWKSQHRGVNHLTHTPEEIESAVDWWLGVWSLWIRCAGPIQEWENVK